MSRRVVTAAFLIALGLAGASAIGCDTTHEAKTAPDPSDAASASPEGEKMAGEKNEQEWQTCLTPEQYRVLREKGTERAFTGKYYKTKTKGVYKCAGCGQHLYSSDAKFDSGSGWPSYWQPVSPDAIKTETDTNLGMVRIEVMCSNCGGHLGHVFDDGPAPTGLRHCINSAAIELEPAEDAEGGEGGEGGGGGD